MILINQNLSSLSWNVFRQENLQTVQIMKLLTLHLLSLSCHVFRWYNQINADITYPWPIISLSCHVFRWYNQINVDITYPWPIISLSCHVFRWHNQTNVDITYPWPIFSILVYFRLGSPMETMVRNFSMISSSVIFFFFGFSVLLSVVPSPLFSSCSIGFVYWNQEVLCAEKRCEGFVYQGEKILCAKVRTLCMPKQRWECFAYWNKGENVLCTEIKVRMCCVLQQTANNFCSPKPWIVRIFCVMKQLIVRR